jgi:hypothetical protein
VTRHLLIALVACCTIAVLPAAAAAKGGQPDVRVSVRCGDGVTAGLRLQVRDNGIRARFEVDHARAGDWNVVLVHERQVAWKGQSRVTLARGSFEIERTVPDFPGSDAVSARATGPRGTVCQATAVAPQAPARVSDGQNGA